MKALATALLAITASVLQAEPTMTVSSTSTIAVPADLLQMNIGVTTRADSAEEALVNNNSKMQAVITSFEGAGLTKKEFSTGRFTISPTYTPMPKDPPSGWRAKIDGYEVTNNLSIKTEKLEMAGKLIDLAGKAGANNIENVIFTLKNGEKLRSDAIKSAADQAITDATTLANAAGVSLGRIERIDLDPRQAGEPQYQSKMLFSARSTEISTPISAGEVELRATVAIIFSIEDQASPISSQR